MSDSVFYCFGIPIAAQSADGAMHMLDATPEDRGLIESRLGLQGAPTVPTAPMRRSGRSRLPGGLDGALLASEDHSSQ